MKPQRRITAAKWLLFGSIAGGLLNVLLYRPFGVIDEIELLLINFILSWLVIGLLSAYVLWVGDVRRHQ